MDFWQIDKDEFKKELDLGESILVDVRTPQELLHYWKIRDNQELITYGSSDFVEKINSLDKSKKYLLYCWHWNRSAAIRDYMKHIWFKWVKDLRWGIDAWNRI